MSQLPGFLGLTNFIAKFIPKSTDIVHPLHNLLQKNAPWNWSNAQEAVFQAVKDEISKASKLSYYDPTKELILENDASDYGLGTAGMQEGKLHMEAEHNRTQRRTIHKLRKRCLQYGLEKYHLYVYGREVIVYTDHKPLVNIKQKSLAKAQKRLQSMLLRI